MYIKTGDFMIPGLFLCKEGFMLDKNLPYMDIIMKARKDIAANQPRTVLPPGYHYKMYESGDGLGWAKLEASVNEFESIEEAFSYFHRVFMPFEDCLSQRMCFITDEEGNIVSTATAWFKENHQQRYPVLHWVSTSPFAQGKGLGGAIVKYALSLFPKVEPQSQEIFLHTQTWSYKAIGMYYKYGFRITNTPLMDCKTHPNCIRALKQVVPDELLNNLMEENF